MQERLEVIGEELIIHLQPTGAMRRNEINKDKVNNHFCSHAI